ncbi:hypothetical protein MRX96_010166 [Rhipicephalus microplus]
MPWRCLSTTVYRAKSGSTGACFASYFNTIPAECLLPLRLVGRIFRAGQRDAVCGKQGHFSRICRSLGSAPDVEKGQEHTVMNTVTNLSVQEFLRRRDYWLGHEDPTKF